MDMFPGMDPARMAAMAAAMGGDDRGALARMFEEMMPGLPLRNNTRGLRQWKAFSLSDHVMERLPDDWVAAKEAGNACLKDAGKAKRAGNAKDAAREYRKARSFYRKGAILAAGPLLNGAYKAFTEALLDTGELTAAHAFGSCAELVKLVLAFVAHERFDSSMMIDGERQTEFAPNRAAAICLANRSAAWLLDGNPERALRDAQAACERDPEYLKAHRREVAALEALGRTEEVAEIKEELEQYEPARAAFPAEALALIAVGWLEWQRAAMVYGPARFRACVEWLKDGPLASNNKCEARASIVPYQGGQVLMLSLCYGYPVERTVDCLDWQMVDHENGDIADAPPHGHASKKALSNVPNLICKYVDELATSGFRVVSVMCGQGLTEHTALVETALTRGYKTEEWLAARERESDKGKKRKAKAKRKGKSTLAEDCPARAGIIVHRANNTAAGEDSGNFALPDARSVAALQARRPDDPDQPD